MPCRITQASQPIYLHDMMIVSGIYKSDILCENIVVTGHDF